MGIEKCSGCGIRYIATNRQPWTRDRIDRHQRACPKWKTYIAQHRPLQSMQPTIAGTPSVCMLNFLPVYWRMVLTSFLQKSLLFYTPNKRSRLSELQSPSPNPTPPDLLSTEGSFHNGSGPLSDPTTNFEPAATPLVPDPSESAELTEVCSIRSA